jgi:putative intracellular protease/amidase
VVVDGQFVSSRKPDDLPAFMKAVLQVMAAQEENEKHSVAAE